MINIGDRYNKCIYVYEFSDNYAYVGLTYNMEVREKSRNKNKKDSVVIHKNETGITPKLKQLTEYLLVDEAIRLEEYYLNEYLNNGWIMLNKRKTGGIGSSSTVWNINRVRRIALNYDNLTSFMKNEMELYEISKRSGWLYSFFSE
jgi:predicted GIY-YIG superfamily endonuclease